MSLFHVGQMVVLIDDRWPGHFSEVTLPVKGMVYTIREIHVRSGEEGILLEEIVNKPAQWADCYGEPGFLLRRFRPVRKTSIEIFRKLVAPSPELVD